MKEHSCIQYCVRRQPTGEQLTFYQVGFTAASNLPNVRTSADDLTEFVTVVKANTLSITSDSDTVAVPTKEQTVATVQYSATVIDNTGSVLENPVVDWSISGPSEAVTIDGSTGFDSVPNTTAAGTYTIMAAATKTNNDTLASDVSVEKTLEVTKTPLAPTTVTVPLDEDTLTVLAGHSTDTAAITATVTGRFDEQRQCPVQSYSCDG